MSTSELPQDPFNETLARRLAQLRSTPVDTSALDRALKEKLPPALTDAQPMLIGPAVNRPAWRTALRPMAAIAASAALMATLLLALQNRPVRASADLMAQLHRDIVSGKTPTMKADSIEQANAAFAAFGRGMPTLSEPPAAHTMACCMRDVGTRKVACVLFDNGGTPVTMAVAEGDTLETSAARSVAYHGENYHVQSNGELNMVTLDRGNHRVCLIGAMPAQRLIGLAEGLKF